MDTPTQNNAAAEIALTHNTGETTDVAQTILNILKQKASEKAIVVGLSGNLGSGKTTFSQSCAQLLGIKDVVTSPTFVIEKVYHTLDTAFPQFIHIDVYRLDTEKDLLNLGFDELIHQKGNLIFVEWPEKVKDILPADTFYISFEFIDETTRKISYNHV